MPGVSKRAAAQRDLLEHFVYVAEHAGWEIANRFLDNAELSFADLARQPKMGAPLELHKPELAGTRKWRVKGFNNHLIFYQPKVDGISIIRVLHAASDWWRLLGLDDR